MNTNHSEISKESLLSIRNLTMVAIISVCASILVRWHSRDDYRRNVLTVPATSLVSRNVSGWTNVTVLQTFDDFTEIETSDGQAIKVQGARVLIIVPAKK